jgi:hypothetical protein
VIQSSHSSGEDEFPDDMICHATNGMLFCPLPACPVVPTPSLYILSERVDETINGNPSARFRFGTSFFFLCGERECMRSPFPGE